MAGTHGTETEKKLNAIIEALKEKKGNEIIRIDLEKLDTSICDHFIICHGDSTTQVDALSDSVVRKVKSELNQNPHHVEGKDNSLWILVDYSDILVHIFLNEQRSFYNLEELWADGNIVRIEDQQK